jgi:pimeloyl-ACP methyl ester carboxylesterase
MHDYEGKLHTPTSLIYGSESNVVSQLDLRYMKKFYAVNIFESQGTHMFPMEFPEETAQLIMQIVDSIEQ